MFLVLVAALKQGQNETLILVPSDEANKQTGYVCPICNHGVTFKAGRFRVPHFSHMVGSDCAHGKGEGVAHMRIKFNLYQQLKSTGWNASMEAKVGWCRTDVMAIKDTRKFCIEVQASSISPDEIDARMIEHSRNGFKTLWVLYNAEVFGTPHLDHVNARKWWLYLQKIQWGCLWFSCDKGLKIRALHFQNAWQTLGLKRPKKVYWGPSSLKLLGCDFGTGADVEFDVAKLKRDQIFWPVGRKR